MAAENFYEDGAAAPAETETETEQETTENTDRTGLLPKTFFGGEVAVGDVCEVKVLAVQDEDVQVQYLESEKEEEDEGEDEGESETEGAPQGGGEMSGMME